MSNEIELGNQQVPQSDWDATPEQIQQVVLKLVEQLKLQNDRITELVEQQRRNSKNSSQPPSKDVIGSKETEGKQRRLLNLMCKSIDSTNLNVPIAGQRHGQNCRQG